jgi:hypothetical protein
MASTASLEEKFNAAVKAIQRLPNDGKRFSYLFLLQKIII